MAIAVLVLVLRQQTLAAPFTTPFWSNVSPSPESAIPPVARLGMSPEGVDVRTGELFWDHFVFEMPGVVEDNRFTLRWRSMVTGASQLGNGVLPGWETTVQYVVLNAQAPQAPGGHQAVVRRPSGRVDTFVWNGVGYTAPADVFDTLTRDAVGIFTLTDKRSNSITFDGAGMPATFTDRNGNTDVYTHNATMQLTGIVDDRGKTYVVVQNGNGTIASIQDPAGRLWQFGYDASVNLKTVTTPATPDQPNGITTTLGYDGMNRLISVTDGRGNAVWQFGYVGTTGQIATVKIDGDTVSYTYAAGVTTRTDRNGNVHRYFHTANRITKTDMWVAGAAKYVTCYGYLNGFLSNVVLPRGNRIDLTWDGSHNLTERRDKTADREWSDPTDRVYRMTYDLANSLTSYTDPLGRVWSFSRDGAGNITGVAHPDVSNPVPQTASESYEYNARGQLLRHTDEEGTVTEYAYYGPGPDVHLLQTVRVDPSGLDLETGYAYDAAGNPTDRTDPNGNVHKRTWDNLRRLTERRAPQPLGYRIQFQYDGNGNRIRRDIENVDKDGVQVVANPWWTTTYSYTNTDDLETLTEEIDAGTDRTTTFEYDKNENRIRVVKAQGNKDKWEFNERDRVSTYVRGETDPLASSIQYTYDQNGNQTAVVDGRGNTTTFTYDLFDRRTKRTSPLGHFTEWTYDLAGNVTRVQEKDNLAVELQREDYSFDERGRMWRISRLFKDPAQTHPDAVTTVERLRTGPVSKATDATGNVSTWVYDAASRKTKFIDAIGTEWSWTYDDNGNTTALSLKEFDGSSSVTHEYESTFDALDRRTTRTEVDRTNATNRYTTQYEYDGRSNLVFRTDAMGNPVRWTFDGLGRMIKRERARTLGASSDEFTSAQVTQWEFDSNSRLVSHGDDGQNVSTWEYDALDRKVKDMYPDGTAVLYVYDKNDNVTRTTDPSGNVIDDTFDAANRNTARTVTRGTGFVGTTTETRVYDALNRVVSNADDDYKLEYEYAVLGLESLVVVERQSYVGPTAYTKTVTKSYDAKGRRIAEAYPSGANLTLGYGYNGAGRLTSIDDGTNTLASYTHVGSRPKVTTLGNGATATVSYTGFRSEVAGVHHQTAGSATIARFEYGYDKNHDRIFERFGAVGSAGDAFVYDRLRRVVRAIQGSTNPASPTGNPYVTQVDYNYDDDGNRTSVVVTPYPQGGATTSYATNALNEYTTVGGTPYVWDANGNLTDNGTYTFAYNYKNLIVEARRKSDGVVVGSYRYDAEGRRVEKATNGQIERYVRSRVREESGRRPGGTGPGPGGRYDMAQVVSVYGGGDTWRQNFVWGDRVDGIEVLEQADVLDFDADGNTAEVTRSYYHRNALGSVMEITDANQAVVVSYRYDPYGRTTITRAGQIQTTDPLGQHWTFTARFLDEETGLLYFRARTYDAETGRFLQRDPLGYAEGPNLFTYVDSSPIRRTDPTGLQGQLDFNDEDAAAAASAREDQEQENEERAAAQGEIDAEFNPAIEDAEAALDSATANVAAAALALASSEVAFWIAAYSGNIPGMAAAELGKISSAFWLASAVKAHTLALKDLKEAEQKKADAEINAGLKP